MIAFCAFLFFSVHSFSTYEGRFGSFDERVVIMLRSFNGYNFLVNASKYLFDLYAYLAVELSTN